ncbi:MAG TPA: hypothetical protein VGK63_01450 [Candidatus Limnocylindrales bacterium]
MSSPDQDAKTDPKTELDALSGEALAEVERVLSGGTVAEVPDETVQALLLAAVRLFSAKRDSGERLDAFPANSVTATDVAVTCVAMTEAVNLELFELALWHGWSNI